MAKYLFETFENIDEGDVIPLPESVGRSTVRLAPGGVEGQTVLAAAVGQGDTSDYVVRTTRESEPDLPDGSVVLGVQEGRNQYQDAALWYAVPLSRFRLGGDDT